METQEALALIARAVPRGPATWADFGAGDGTFTVALADLLGPNGRVYAVERNARALATLERRAQRASGQGAARVISVRADFTESFELPGLDPPGLDGMLLANALHFNAEPGVVLARLIPRLKPGGRVVLVEYDGRRASRWVPYPIPVARLPEVAAAAGLATPEITATRPSGFGGVLYVAAAERRP